MSNKIAVWTGVLALLVSLAAPNGTAVEIGRLGVNFVGAGSPVAPNQGFGFEGQTNWNNAEGEDGTLGGLMLGSGISTGATISWTSAGADVGHVRPFIDAVWLDPANEATSSGIYHNGATGPQDGLRTVLEGRIRTQNIGIQLLGAPPIEPIEISLTGLSDIFSSYYAYVYFSSPNDQGDQYNVVFSDGTTSVQQFPSSSAPLVDSQTGSGGRSAGGFRGYDDNFTLIGNAFTPIGPEIRGNDSVAVSSPQEEIFTGDTLTISVHDTNDNGNSNNFEHPDPELQAAVRAESPTEWQGIPNNGGPNWGPQANVGVGAIQIVGTLLELLDGDYNRDRVVDAADYTLWRDTLGQTVAIEGIGADGNKNGVIDAGDYDFWKMNFGGGSGSLLSASIPEPSTMLIIGVGLAGAIFVARRMHA